MGAWESRTLSPFGGRPSRPNIPGVIYSEDWQPPRPEEIPTFEGGSKHILVERMPQALADRLDDMVKRPAPEDVPYTFWELIGAVPVNVTRLRPRQFYYPTTDFSRYEYDAQSPEERMLKMQWFARLYDVQWQVPVVVWSVGACASIAFPPTIRLPMLAGSGVTAVLTEAVRCYLGAAHEREALDDFLIAKEVWYIKNDETKRMQLETLEPGVNPVEWEGQQRRQAEVEELERIRDALYAVPVNGGRGAPEEPGGVFSQTPGIVPRDPFRR